MKRKTTRILAAVAALFLGFTLNAFDLTIDDGCLTGFTGDVPANLVIPNTVKTIDDGVFCAEAGDMSALASVTIPTSVVYIGENAFAGCSNLEEVVFEEKDPEALLAEAVGFAETLEIGVRAFAGCTALTQITIPAHVSTIGELAFEGCAALEWADFLANDSVTDSYLDVCDFAFAGCEALESVSFDDRPYDPDNNVWNAIHIVASAFEECAALTDLHLGEGVVDIGDCAFGGIGIESLDVPASVQSIGEGAFASSVNLAEVYFAGYDVYGEEYYVDMDEDSAFEDTPYGNRFRLVYEDDCIVGYKGVIPEDEMVDLEIPDCVTRIGDGAFEGLERLCSVYISTNVTYVGEDAFAGCPDLENVTFEGKAPELVEYSWVDESGVVQNGTYLGFDATLEIGARAFSDCTALTRIDFPAHVYAVGEYAFSGCTALEDVVFRSDYDVEQSRLTIYDCAFGGCEVLQRVSFEDRLWNPDNDDVDNEVYVGEGSFADCAALTDLYLGEGVVEIYDNAFSGIGIEELEIPATVYYVGDYAFAYCENLADIYLAGVDIYGEDYEIDMDEDSVFEGTPFGNRFRRNFTKA